MKNNNLAGRITDSLINVGAAPSQEKALYEYGIRLGLMLVINIATAVLIGLTIGMVWQSIIFLIAYGPIRTYAGGYHARTQLKCYLLSIPMMYAVLLSIKMIPWNNYIFAITLFCAIAIIEIVDPGEEPNKPLSEREQVVYKKRTRAYAALFSGAAIMLWLAGLEQLSLSVLMALGLAAVMLILGAIINGNNTIEKA